MKKLFAGFTLIELMVSVTVMGILVSGGIAAYRRFNDRQRVFSAGKEFVQILRQAQKRAKSGDKPDAGCIKLDGYRVATNTSQVLTYALCDGAQYDLISEKNFEADITFQPNVTYDFLVLAGGVNGAGIVQMGIPTVQYEIEVTLAGSISGREL